MSKYDNLFNNSRSEVRSDYITNKSNSFIFKAKDDVNKKITYDYQETAFPDLALNKPLEIQVNRATTQKYSDIAAIINEKVKVKENPVPPGWIQYSRSKQSHLFEVTYGSKTKRQLKLENEELQMSNPLYIYKQMTAVLECRWAKYMIQYDKIHGEGAYHLLHYTEPIYNFDEDLSDEKDGNNEYDYDYNSSNSQENYKKHKKYSVSKKQ
jgi:hypothetical protein